MGDNLGCINIQNHGQQAISKTTYMTRVKGSESRPLIFIFRLNIFLHDSYQVHETVIEIQEWKQKILGNFAKSYTRTLLSLLETSTVS